MTVTITHPGCEARWSGTTAEHCPACHLTFASTQAGEAHRTGRHGVTEGPHRRRCLTEDEMRARTVPGGVLKGQPWFAEKVNVHGTVIWLRRKAEKASWFSGQDGSAGLAAPVGAELPETVV